jgi:soluble lytic murein transglycosylase-like protein
LKFLPAIVIVCLATALPAEAQIYTWRDSSGHLVLSNKPRGAGDTPVATYAVPGPELLRTTNQPAITEGQSRYEELIRAAASAHNLSPDLVRAIIRAESGFNPRAVSAKGAMGLMQLMPATARELGVVDPFHPAENIRGGVTYLARLLSRYDQNLELALAAYNAGPGTVERYGAVPPYRETRDYVKKIAGATKGAAAGAGPPSRLGPVIYKWIATVGGKPAVRYSNRPPKDVPYEVVNTR